jgi:Phage portal protein, SPP1 Gp6-like
MANQTLVEDYTRLAMVNREYGRNRSRWQFLLDSYVGGEDYRRAGYLTKYQLESEADYNARLRNTPYDNHCSAIISVYLSFLFRNNIERNFGDWEGMADLEQFLENSDFEGRSFNAFMKDVAQWSSVFGHCWILMTKPDVGAKTLAQELEAEVRPVVSVITPIVVNDWNWHRHPNGSYQLVYIKYVEEVVDKITIVKEWTPKKIMTWKLDDQKKEAEVVAEEDNGLGIIPAILVYNKKSIVRGQGVSDLQDIADVNRMIYNLTSEREQSHRMDGHPSLVVPPTAQLGSGAGALIVLQDGSDPGLNPYYLSHNGANVTSLKETLGDLVERIDSMANVGSVRAVRAPTAMSGVALETEFQLLNARLSEKADGLELAEEQLWRLFGMYQGRSWDGFIKYPDSFSMKDVQREYTQLQTAKAAATGPEVFQVIDYRLRELLDDPSLPEEGTQMAAAGYEEQGNAFALTQEQALPGTTQTIPQGAPGAAESNQGPAAPASVTVDFNALPKG